MCNTNELTAVKNGGDFLWPASPSQILPHSCGISFYLAMHHSNICKDGGGGGYYWKKRGQIDLDNQRIISALPSYPCQNILPCSSIYTITSDDKYVLDHILLMK